MAKVTFRFEEGEPVVTYATEGERLLEVAQKSNVPIDAPCSGNASCGKCRVRLVSGELDSKITRHISEEEYQNGWRLACVSTVKGDVEVEVPEELRTERVCEAAGTIILSRTQKLSQEKLEAAAAMLREKNPDAAILTTPWDELDGKTILSAVEKVSLSDELLEKMRREHEIEEAEHEHEHHHHHDHDEHDEHDHEHEHHHDHDEDEHDHEHGHHHDHDHDEHDEHEHHHHHHDGEECDDPECECHHHHHHHADDVFSSWGKETPKKFSKEALEDMLHKLDSGDYGHILRAKGIVNGEDGWLEFDYVPEEHEVRAGHPDYTGRLCVIGAELKEDGLAELFGV